MWTCPKCRRSFRNRSQFHACHLRGRGARMWQPPKGTASARPRKPPAGMTVPGWTCPRCGRTFKNRSQAHSCVTVTVDDFYRGKPEARRLHDAVAAYLATFGPFRVHAQKTRIAFIATMSFAGIQGAGRDWVDFGFVLRRPVDDPRLRATLEVRGNWYGYRLRVTHPEQLAASWLRPLVAESYAVGTNEFYRAGPSGGRRAPTAK